MTLVLFLLAVIGAISIAGFVSGAETALTSASRAYIFHLAKKGNARAQKTIELQQDMSNVISTILVMNQLVAFLITTGVTLFSVKFLPATYAIILQTTVGILLVVYAEIFPKMLAIRFSTQFALFVAPTIKIMVKILHPIIFVLERCSYVTLKILGVRENQQTNPEQADEELRGAIEMRSSNGDQEEAEKKSMLTSILDLENISVNHVMIHRKHLHTISASLSIEEIADELTNCPFSRVPLWKNDPENIIGILKTKTFFRALQLKDGHCEKLNINELLSPPWFIPETTHLLEQLQNFKKRREHFALVVDEYGDLLGCITLEDILEEIVGEIVDEYDTSDIQDGVKIQADGSVIVDGVTPIRDVNRQFNWILPEDNASTVGGYVMYEVRKIPDVGQVYMLDGFRFEILRRQGNQITLLRITAPETI